jgi:molybdate transport system permease protein
MPLAVYLLQETNQEAVYILSLVLLLISLVVLVGLRHRWLGSA